MELINTGFLSILPPVIAIGLALITYTIMKVVTGKAKEVSALTYVLSLIFIVKFFLVA